VGQLADDALYLLDDGGLDALGGLVQNPRAANGELLLPIR
jgi:hypothetical protein